MIPFWKCGGLYGVGIFWVLRGSPRVFPATASHLPRIEDLETIASSLSPGHVLRGGRHWDLCLGGVSMMTSKVDPHEPLQVRDHEVPVVSGNTCFTQCSTIAYLLMWPRPNRACSPSGVD